jgi:hypothetical protein
VVRIVAILIIKIRHPAGAALDMPFLWILVAMLNLLRLRNGYRVKGLRAFCIGANVTALAAEVVRGKTFGRSIVIEPVPILGQTILSVPGNNDACHS